MSLVTQTVAVTGMNATDNPAPGVAVARALRAAPDFAGRIVGLGYDALDPGFYAEGLLDGAALLPYPSAGRAALLAKLREVRRALGMDVLLPTLDSELRAVGGLRDELAAEGIATFTPRLPALEAASKAHLAGVGAEHGFLVPESEPILTPDPIHLLIERWGLPIVIKGVYYGASVVYSEVDAIAAFHHYVASWGLPVIAQRFIGGEEYDIAALGDGEGGTIGAVPMRKMMLTDKGKGWSGVSVGDPELLATTEKVIAALRWRGGLEVECLREAKSGNLYVAEINPRFPAWVFMTVGAGQNLPFASVELALGHHVDPLPPFQVGTRFVRISLDQVGDLSTYATLRSAGLMAAPSQEDP
ncbi:MAG: ATP-grasp domain-containing protein [Myxococcales bacterium]|nr:ATP-grasp domain-containing protein [Myxococcales bacterium]